MNNTTEVPLVAFLFEPFLLVVFIVGIVSNTLLLLLICKTYKVINSTNIYLFSLGLTYLLRCIYVMGLMVTLAAREWILGGVICSINQLLYRMTINLTAVIYFAIARDRYQAVIYPLSYCRVKKRNAVITSLVLWAIAIGLSLPGTTWAMIQISAAHPLLWGNCFGEVTTSFSVEVPSIALDTVNILVSIVSISITLVYYGFILKELHSLSTHRSQYRMMSGTTFAINSRDRPIFCSAEERAAKSLIIITFFQFACGFSTGLLSTVRFAQFLKVGIESEALVLIYILLLFIHMLPIINPALLIAFNKRFRNRLKGLLKCKIVPESNAEQDVCSLETSTVKAKKPASAIFITNNPVFLERV